RVRGCGSHSDSWRLSYAVRVDRARCSRSPSARSRSYSSTRLGSSRISTSCSRSHRHSCSWELAGCWALARRPISSLHALADGRDDAVSCVAVHLSDDLAHRSPTRLRVLGGIGERPLDPRDDVLEAPGLVERSGARELAIVLADDVLQ